MDVNKDVERVLWAIRTAGGHPLLVGGCVRDHIMGIASKDIDIEVYGMEPDILLDTLRLVGPVKEAGVSFGVFKIRVGETDLDVSVPRKESKFGAGHRGFTVIPDSSLGKREASARRDFTINAIMYDPQTKTFIDLHGGMRDLEGKILRHTSGAFGEDPLRVLRAIQFVARFGFRIHPQTVDVCFRLKDTFSELSIERIWGEFEKIGTKGTHIDKALDALYEIDWIGLFPELVLVDGKLADRVAERCDTFGIVGQERFILVFAALLDGLSSSLVRSFLERIGCPEHLIARIVPLTENIPAFWEDVTEEGVRRLARSLWPSSINDLYVITPNDAWMVSAIVVGVSSAPEKPILTGDHLIAAGMKPGPAFKVILMTALDLQDSGAISTEAEAIEWMERNVQV